jgi:hypothetical protein
LENYHSSCCGMQLRLTPSNKERKQRLTAKKNSKYKKSNNN